MSNDVTTTAEHTNRSRNFLLRKRGNKQKERKTLSSIGSWGYNNRRLSKSSKRPETATKKKRARERRDVLQESKSAVTTSSTEQCQCKEYKKNTTYFPAATAAATPPPPGLSSSSCSNCELRPPEIVKQSEREMLLSWQTDRQTVRLKKKQCQKREEKNQEKEKNRRSGRQRRGGLIDNRPQETIKRCNGSRTQHQISSHCRRANNNKTNNNDQNANKKTAQETQEQRRENPTHSYPPPNLISVFYCSKKPTFHRPVQ